MSPRRRVPASPTEPAERRPSPEAAPEGGPWRVLLYNDQVHTFCEVIALLAKATGHDLHRCLAITEEVHIAGHAEVIRADAAKSEDVAAILRDGGLLAAIRPV